jgi:hypothetical protein
VYADLTNGLEPDQKQKIDAALGQSGPDKGAQASREREAVNMAMRFVK